MNHNHSFDVIVVGAGVIGLSAAIAMKQRGYSVALFDAKPINSEPASPNSRVYALNTASIQLLQALAAWPRIDPFCLSIYQKMHVWDSAGKGQLNFDCRTIAANSLGIILEETVLKKALFEEATHQSIHFFPSTAITQVQTELTHVRLLAEKREYCSKLLIVADGALSSVRDLLNISMVTWPYEQQALVATVHTEFEHQKTAYQVFTTEGPLAFLPLSDSKACSIVWSTSPEHTKRLMSLSDENFSIELTRAFSAKLGNSVVASKRQQYPLIMRHVQQYSGQNWILMGDAAHTIHPLAGLGLNLGLADLSAWLVYLDHKQTSTWSKKTLSAYQRQRKHAVWQIVMAMELLNRLFMNQTKAIVSLRDIGLSWVDQCNPIKRFLIEHAAGVPLNSVY